MNPILERVAYGGSPQRPLVTEARKYLGTPWRHNQCCLGVGIDCVQFCRVVSEAVGVEPIPFENYYRTPTATSLLDLFDRHPNFQRVDRLEAGTILLLRIAGVPHHVAIATSETTMIHADSHFGVVEHNIGNWLSRVVALYQIQL
jgi:cell wall-associated NlpC family hydrolase